MPLVQRTTPRKRRGVYRTSSLALTACPASIQRAAVLFETPQTRAASRVETADALGPCGGGNQPKISVGPDWIGAMGSFNARPRVQSRPRSFLPTTLFPETFDLDGVPGRGASCGPLPIRDRAPPRSVRTCDHPHHQTRLVASHWFASVLLSHARVSLPCDSGQLSHVAARYTRCFLSKCGNPGQTHRLVFHDRGPYYPGCHRAQRNAPVALIRRSELLRLPPSS